ncbi:MAG: SPASM domain-containing protein, partial [Anaerolineaceae bacterium]|nr:SPASM domain-containing protein [Anaerolineaceae bacterium]
PEVYLQRLVFLGDGQKIGADATMVPDQTLFSALERQEMELLAESEWLAAEMGMVFHASGAATPRESIEVKGDYPWQGCLRPWILMYITANGTALPCCISPFAAADFRTIILGNVLEKPLAEVWKGHKYQELRQAVLSEAPGPWPCQFCGLKWSL